MRHSGNAFLHARLSSPGRCSIGTISGSSSRSPGTGRCPKRRAHSASPNQPSAGASPHSSTSSARRLFVRSGTGWALSPAGQGILSTRKRWRRRPRRREPAPPVGTRASRGGPDHSLRMDDRDRARARLTPFLARHPALSIDLVAEARKLNLFRREADIAVRPSKFQQLEIFQRAIAVIEFGLYASSDISRAWARPILPRKARVTRSSPPAPRWARRSSTSPGFRRSWAGPASPPERMVAGHGRLGRRRNRDSLLAAALSVMRRSACDCSRRRSPAHAASCGWACTAPPKRPAGEGRDGLPHGCVRSVGFSRPRGD